LIFECEWMNFPSIFYVQVGIDIVMCGLILYFLWRVGMKNVPSAPGDAARQELERLIMESQQSAQHFLDALEEGRRSLQELSSLLEEKEAHLKALCQRLETGVANAGPRSSSPASDRVDREEVVEMHKDGASISDIVRKTGLTEGEVHLIIDLARSRAENG
jgi:hypothetical protein